MAFDSDYWHALDKQSAQNLDVSPKDIGISMGAGDVLQGIQSAINMGAGTVELGFTGRAKGSLGQGSTTPEMFGTDKREAIRQLSKLNDINVTTHASIGVGNLSGMGQRGFERQTQADTLNEIKRTVDFAADTTQGGSITVHTSEFPRTVKGQYEGFELYPEEEKKAPIYLVDNVTGEIKQAITRDTQLPFEQKDEHGNIITNEKGEPEVKLMDFDQFRRWKNKTEGVEWDDETAAQEFFRSQLSQRKEQMNFEKRRWGHTVKEMKEQVDQFEAVEKSIDNLYQRDPEAAKYNAMKWAEQMRAAPSPTDEEKYKDFLENPIKYLKEKKKDFEYQKKYYEDAVVSYAKQEKQMDQEMERIVPISQVGMERTSETLADAAIYAWQKEQAQDLPEPLFIAPENIFPESGYGSHPEELKEMVLAGRKKMVEKLQQRGMSEGEARQIAKGHIKATFDIGHAYTWKKFFQAEEGESFKDTEKRFNKWLLKEVDKLNEEGIIGHVHLSDNFGYYDEHLTPGTGSAPIKEFVKKMREAGHTDPMIAEGGAQATEEYYQAMTGSWKHLARSPMYRTQKWSDIEDSYFGQTSSPTYMVGKYVPSQEYIGTEKGAPFWTGLGLE
ncbi:MAG: sugar phosphate isomerase/epimerase [Nanoarchaeota archaeon]|nr:sugar phosphate isomerase/epimerase [Nanoarchaeota archaeon]MCG2717724.1 sugar phosphate isomerase/epimerase [Nanoarchaeota archaeon]